MVGGRQGAEDSVLSALAKRPQAPLDFLSRYERILARTAGWQPLEFAEKIVLELGCGPHLGFGPLAVYLGAECFVAADPTATPAIFESDALRNRYFLPLYKDLSAVFGAGQDFEGFWAALAKKTVFYADSTDVAKAYPGAIDIELSNSCLEHIGDLPRTLADLKGALSPTGRFLHAVDFGNHRETANPFDGIYNATPGDYRRQFGTHINLVPPGAMLAMFEGAGFKDASLAPYYHLAEGFSGPMAPYWLEHVPEEERFLKVALFAGPVERNGRWPTPQR